MVPFCQFEKVNILGNSQQKPTKMSQQKCPTPRIFPTFGKSPRFPSCNPFPPSALLRRARKGGCSSKSVLAKDVCTKTCFCFSWLLVGVVVGSRDMFLFQKKVWLVLWSWCFLMFLPRTPEHVNLSQVLFFLNHRFSEGDWTSQVAYGERAEWKYPSFQEEKSNCLGEDGWLRKMVRIVVVVVFDLMSVVTLSKQPLVLEWRIQKPVFRNLFEISQSSS